MIFKGQNLQIRLNTKQDLTLATNPKVKYFKPNSLNGQWSASISGSEIVCNCSPSDIDYAGDWNVQCYYELGGQRFYGSIVSFRVENPLN